MIKQMLVGFFLAGFAASVMAHGGSHREGWVDVSGNVHFGEIPVCALVLINGVTQFSCDGTGGYDMEVPIDDNGMITVMVFADGFAPFNQIVTPEQADEYPIDILLDQNSPTFEVVSTYEPSATVGRFVISGTVNFGAIPVCALVLANGMTMFSCNENQGKFTLDVPLDQDGNITLMVFAAGFKPYKKIIQADPDTDVDGFKDSLDEDDDNDGIFDEFDSCPLNPREDCAIPITDTIIVKGKEWAQVGLFLGLSWSALNTVCSAGSCSGVLNGYDMAGWTWASLDDVNALMNYYAGKSIVGPGAAVTNYMEVGSTWAPLIFIDGMLPTYNASTARAIYGLSRNTLANDAGFTRGYFIADSIPSVQNDAIQLEVVSKDRSETVRGGWFYRKPLL